MTNENKNGKPPPISRETFRFDFRYNKKLFCGLHKNLISGLLILVDTHSQTDPFLWHIHREHLHIHNISHADSF